MFPASFRPRAFSLLAPGLICLLALATPARSEEDPLLGRIKVIQCVGCTPGSVDLVIHDPIDVRDFLVRINETDYQKIITPLVGKTVYDKGGCFYWMDVPKAVADSAKGKEAAKGAKTPAKAKAQADSAGSDSGSAGGMAPPLRAEVQGTPSRCISYARVETKPTHVGKKED